MTVPRALTKFCSMQEVEYSMWARDRERGLRARAATTKVRGSIPRFSMAFQPIVDVLTSKVFAYESLVRSQTGESAGSVLSKVPLKNFHLFDMACRSKGMELALQLGVTDTDASIAVNVNPVAAVEANSHLSLTCTEAVDIGFPLNRLILEFVEDAQLYDPNAMRQLMSEYQELGVRVAIDDFGAGYSGLSLLTSLHPDIVKLDMGMVRRIASDRATRVVLKAMASACFELGVQVVAEGVETPATMNALVDIGVVLQQGYLFARPEFERFPSIAAFELPQKKSPRHDV